MRGKSFISCILLAAGVARPATAGRPLELRDYYRIETASDPAISPDGRWVAFVRNYIIESENRRQSEIWLAPADGSEAPRRLTHPVFNSSRPRWSPDGKLLAFESRRRLPGEKTDEAPTAWFLRMDAAGGEAFQIPGVEGTPVFSPDNRWIAFVKKTPPPADPAKPRSEFERQIEERFKGRIFDWMNYRFDRRGYLPDPRDPRATPPEELYVVAREGGSARQLTTLGVTVQSPVWRPDSGALAFAANTHQRNEHTYERPDLFVVELDGQVRRLTDDGYENADPAWTPHGRSIVFRREQGLDLVIQSKQRHGSPVDIYLIPASGEPMRNLTGEWDLIPGSPTVSADGRSVYFAAENGGNSHLYRVSLEGGRVEQVTSGDRRLSGFSFPQDFAVMAFSATEPARPAEALSARIDGSAEKRLSRLSDAFVAEVTLASPQRVQYTSNDGTPIEGWVVPPAGYDAAKGPYPLVLRIHGGPHGAYGNDFSFESQLLAASGYVVLYTNPRGSTGYGEKFLWATWGGWGVLDFQDLMAGVDHLLKKYAIGEKRLGVGGYSYGGFMTNWIIGHTQRFAAATAGAGISNWVSDYGTADIPRTKETEFYGPPWRKEGFDLMVKLSPLTHVANAKTPTLFIHGESDHRVPIEEAEQMYTALRKLKVPAKFIRYPDSYHGGWSPWNMVHRYYQELKWWEQHLEAGPTNDGTR